MIFEKIIEIEKYYDWESIFRGSLKSNNYSKTVNYVSKNNVVVRFNYEDNISHAKYLLSFNGGANWYTFSGGRWINASKSTIPTIADFEETGMTAEEVNSITPSDFSKLYSDGSDILTVNVAVYMMSNSVKITPVIKNIIIETQAPQSVDKIFRSQINKYKKNEYRSISSIFPIESFEKPAECYYLFGLGNDWLYTYKDEKLVKLLKNAPQLFENVSDNWIEIKQYGMNSGELRNVNSEALTKLLVNDNYANTEFALI